MLPLLPTTQPEASATVQPFWTRPSAQNRLREVDPGDTILTGKLNISDAEVTGERVVVLTKDWIAYTATSDHRIRGLSGLFNTKIDPFEEITPHSRSLGIRLTRSKVHILDLFFPDEITLDQWQTVLVSLCTRPGFSDKYRSVHKIGAGHFGTVSYAEETATGKLFAVKSVPKAGSSDIESEVAILRMMQVKGVSRLVDVCEDEKLVYLVMERAPGVDLDSFLRRNGRVREEVARGVVRELLGVVEEVHALGVVHRDIKPSNVMVDIPPAGPLRSLTLIDFGLALPIATTSKSKCGGTIGYIAPEQLRKEGFNCKADMFSLGVLAYMLVAGESPFAAESEEKMATLNARGKVRFREREWRSVSKECIEFIRELTHLDQTKRPTAREALLHPWFAHCSIGTVTRESSVETAVSAKDMLCTDL